MPTNRRFRLLRTGLFAAATCLLSWLLMQAVHELGHVLAAIVTGGIVTHVELHPLRISRTDVSPNPIPLLVIWAGPVIGCLLPVACWLLIQTGSWACAIWWRFFAGFCLVANGCYLGTAIVAPVGDARELLRHGTPIWSLALFGAFFVPAGFALWNGQGTAFGIGRGAEPPNWRRVSIVVTALLVVVAAELFWSGSGAVLLSPGVNDSPRKSECREIETCPVQVSVSRGEASGCTSSRDQRLQVIRLFAWNVFDQRRLALA